MNDTVRRRRNQKLHLSCHPETRSPLPGKIQSKLASAARVLRLVSRRRRLVLATGIAILLCLAWAGCTGFFVNPSISSIFITPASTTIAVNGSPAEELSRLTPVSIEFCLAKAILSRDDKTNGAFGCVCAGLYHSSPLISTLEINPSLTTELSRSLSTFQIY